MTGQNKHKLNFENGWLTNFRKCLACLLTFTFVCAPLAYAQITPSREDQVKAAYIFNFTKFTTWPESKFSKHESPIVIGIFGKDPFGVLIDELVKGELVQGRPIAIKRFNDLEHIADCHVLYVHRLNNVALDDIIKNTKSFDVLTISDIEGFTIKGGFVKFYQVDGKMKFEINGQMVKNSGLTISSRLLRLAEICCNEKRN